MTYIGNKSSANFTSLEKQDLTGASGTSLTLTHAVANAFDIALYINNVRQEPNEAYTTNGTTVNLTGTVTSSDDIYVLYLAKAVQTTVPPDGSVGTAKIADTAVTNAKIANSTIDLASKVTGVLPSANGGSFATASFKAVNDNATKGIGGNPIIYPDVTTAAWGAHNVGNHYNTSTGKFIIPVTGVYFFLHSAIFSSMGGADVQKIQLHRTDDDGSSNASILITGERWRYQSNYTGYDGYILGQAQTNGYFTAGQAIYASGTRSGSTPVIPANNQEYNFFCGFRIG
tara:strand:- start:47 stop:904 length:858 start_codon:yes stop_codon:yes gene_type:complete